MRKTIGTLMLTPVLSAAALTFAAEPTTAPTTQNAPHGAANAPHDAATDWLLGTATTQPAAPASTDSTQPAAQPAASPLLSKDQLDPDARHGTITFSDGKTITGTITTTVGKPLRTWDEQIADYRDTPMRFVKSIKAQVVWERDEAEWRFKESGSDVKIYTGRTYPARETSYVLTLTNGKTVKGDIVAPLYFRDDQGNQTTYILHKRDKGEMGQKLKDLVYVAEVNFAEVNLNDQK